MLFFDYELPPHLIAQHPATPRDSARLMVLRVNTQSLSHHVFRDLPDVLSAGDLLVLNDTKVLPARLVGHRERTGGRWECLFVREYPGGGWEVLAKTRGHPESGEVFVTTSGLRLTLTGRTADRHWLMRPDRPGSPAQLLTEHGMMPIPPYIREGQAEPEDSDRYQTVYAQHIGSVAAPTAGLHFTPELFSRLADNGIKTARVTLHVGLGTFAPVHAADPREHPIHGEWCEVGSETIQTIQETKAQGGRVIAVGTTTTRTLETSGLQPFCGESTLYIYPPFSFRVIDGLITNFHLPRTTLLLLTQALAGSDFLRKAYQEAVTQGYRFYSYGDAMLIL